MASFALNEIPGYREALTEARRRLQEAREDAWLDLPTVIGGFTLRTMTVADFVLLDKRRSPFLFRTAPTLDDLKIFLWVLSPGFGRWLFGKGARRQFPTVQHLEAFLHGQRVHRAFGRNVPESSEAAAVACFAYIDKMFLDAPPEAGKGGESCGCYLGMWFDALQSEHHLSSDEIWRMPLPQVFQRLKSITRRKNPSVPEFNAYVDKLNGFVLTGLRSQAFTEEDLLAGRVKMPQLFGEN
jgi:hypothetical protein